MTTTSQVDSSTSTTDSTASSFDDALETASSEETSSSEDMTTAYVEAGVTVAQLLLMPRLQEALKETQKFDDDA